MAAGFRAALRVDRPHRQRDRRAARLELRADLRRAARRAGNIDRARPQRRPRASRPAPRVPRAGGRAQLAPRERGQPANVTVRGVTPRAFVVRDGIRVVEGRTFAPGLAEVIVGRRISRAASGSSSGDTVTSGRRASGRGRRTSTSTAAAFESEVWGDYTRSPRSFSRGRLATSLVVRMKDPAAIPELRPVDHGPAPVQVQARQRAEVLRGPVGSARPRRSAVSPPSSRVVMAVGAVFGAINTMYASFGAAPARSARCEHSASRVGRSSSPS